MDKNTDPCPIEGNGDIGNNVTSSKNPETLEQQVLPPTSQIVQNTMGVRKNYKRVVHRGKKGSSQVLSGRRYTSGSSENGARVLRSRSSSKTAPVEPVQIPVQPPAKRRKRGRPSKGSPRKRGRPSNGSQTDEFSQFRKRIRYILNRMNYEQSFIEAYANDGWKSQSLEKIRPEKELDRAKGEILKCKLQIREVFQNLDSLLTKGKIDESLFDSDGEIACEDIFCATCGSKDVTSSNDIILCDGVCDRGFHQNCLNPPLLSEDIPEGDEGWLCPACDCKINCIDVINELQGSNLSIEDSWEKVFPEAAAMASGSKQDDAFDLPSDDSEDDDFDPDMVEGHMASKEEGSSEEDEGEGSDSDDSNFLTSSDDSEPLMDKKKADDLGLPSEDSEDDDYDPACPDSDKDIQNEKPCSDDSDFTSDSDDFCAEIAKSGGHDEVTKPSFPDAEPGDTINDHERNTVQANTANASLNSLKTEMYQNLVLRGSGRREVERLDYKKLYDETYDKESSDSSDNKEWSGNSTPEKGNQEPSEAEANLSAGKSSRKTRVARCSDELTPTGSADQKCGGGLTSNGSNSTTMKGRFGPIVNQRLREHFKTEQYPSRTVKESLAEELGITSRQVSRWFETRRRFAKAASAKKGVQRDCPSDERTKGPVVASMQVKDPENIGMEKPDLCRKETENDSDFTSDSDDFCAEIAKSGGHDEVTEPSFPDAEPGDTINDNERNTVQANTANASLNSLKTEMDQNLVLRGSGRREVERLDNKKLYDKTYDKESPDSSDDEEWSGNSTPEKGNQDPSEAEANLSAGKSSRKTRVARRSDELTPNGSADQKCGGGLTSNGSNSTTMKGRFGPIVNQRLHEHFKTEQYPSRAVKESLAEELGITSCQVSRWFETRRRFAKAASAKKGVQQDCPSDEKTKGPVVASMQVKDPEDIGLEKPDARRKETENEDATHLNECCKQQGGLKKRIKRGRGLAATPPGSKQGYATNSRNVRSPKGGSVSGARRSNGNSTEGQIPEVELADETRKKVIQRGLKKKKTSR